MPTDGGQFQYSFEHHLYLLLETADTTQPGVLTSDVVESGGAPDDGDINNPNTGDGWFLYDIIRTLNLTSDPTTADITVRREGRSGFNTQVDVYRSHGLTYQIRYRPRPDTAPAAGAEGIAGEWNMYQALVKAMSSGSGIAAIDVDKPVAPAAGGATWVGDAGSDGSFGLVGNWSVSVGNTKEIDGIVFADATFRLTSLPAWVLFNYNGGTGQLWTKVA